MRPGSHAGRAGAEREGLGAQALRPGDMTVARTWRAAARAAFLHYLPRGFHVTAFVPGHGRDATYLLSR